MMTKKIFDARGNGGGGICPTITGDHQNRITDYTAIVVIKDEENVQEDSSPDVSGRVTGMGRNRHGRHPECV